MKDGKLTADDLVHLRESAHETPSPFLVSVEPEALTRLFANRDRLRKGLKAQQQLLTAYRTGCRRTPEKALDTLAKLGGVAELLREGESDG